MNGTLGSFISRLFGEIADADLLRSPPDLFAFAAFLLHGTGGYLRVVQNWPPPEAAGGDWCSLTRERGQAWRNALVNSTDTPDHVVQLWNEIRNQEAVELSVLRNTPPSDHTSHPGILLNKLLELLAITDEAASELGLPPIADNYEEETIGRAFSDQLEGKKATFCRYADPSLAAVLPKSHTPKSGLTIRSLSHHLALIPSGEVDARWYWAQAGESGFSGKHINVLILPWPLEILPRNFRPAEPPTARLTNMPEGYAFFEYAPHLMAGWLDKTKALLESAKERIGDIDVIVFPELSMTEAELDSLSTALIGLPNPPVIVAGALFKESGRIYPRNVCATMAPGKDDKGVKKYARTLQDKHHRWRVDPRQVKQYGLGSQLSPSNQWWELSEMASRSLSVFALKPWLTLCTLICEDLARPDPIADTVRAIGPNLVIALLMDGPQLRTRWPARYGSVLADDPGSSVLTLTSLGMSLLSTPGGVSPSRAVALWTDAMTGSSREIELPKDCSGLVLCLTWEESEEFSADGRDCGETTAHVTLSGVHCLQ